MDAEWEIPFEELEFTNHLPTARGAFAEVYRGKWRKIEVAIKVFESRNSLDKSDKSAKSGPYNKLDKLNLDKLNKEEKERLNELRILTLVHHPNIVMFLGYAKILATKICLVFEWMHGGNLFDTIYTHPFKHSYQKRILWSRDISTAVLYLHQRTPTKIIHRDLKPTNCLMDKYGSCKITDFGISKTVIIPKNRILLHHSPVAYLSNSSLYQLQRTNESEGTSTSAVYEDDNNKGKDKDEKEHRSVGAVGTFRYMAPEIMEEVLIIDDVESKNDIGELCKKHRTSENLDMYSLGMILYFIWEDKQPFWDWESSSCPLGAQESTKERMMSFCKYVYEGNRPRFYKTPGRIQKVIRQCWHVDPSQRPNADSIVSIFEETSGTVKERCLFSLYNLVQRLCTSL